LQTLQPYPDTGAVKKLQEQKAAVTQRIVKLQQTLSTMELPVEPMSPQQFQDRLRASVSATVEKARAAGIALPSSDRTFFLGFETYQTTLPAAEAAPALGRQLAAIELAVNTLIEDRITAIKDLKRTPLPEEEGSGAAPAGVLPKPGATGVGKGAPGKPKSGSQQLVRTDPFDIALTADQPHLRKALDDLVNLKRQFYIVRTLAIVNQQQQAPSRNENGAASGADAAATPAPDQAAAPAASPAASAAGGAAPASGGGDVSVPSSPAAGGPLRFIFGAEKLDVTMRIEVVEFAPPGAAVPAAKK